jgi:hypothetical protein
LAAFCVAGCRAVRGAARRGRLVTLRRALALANSINDEISNLGRVGGRRAGLGA